MLLLLLLLPSRRGMHNWVAGPSGLQNHLTCLAIDSTRRRLPPFASIKIHEDKYAWLALSVLPQLAANPVTVHAGISARV
jgi:hypothetical protein